MNLEFGEKFLYTGVTELEFISARVSDTGAFDEKFYVLIQSLWQKPDSGYHISMALKGLTDVTPVTEVEIPMSVVAFEVENKPRKPLLIADILLRVFHEVVLENDTGNRIIHACFTKKNYPVSKPMWNKFTEAAAECDTSPEATMVVVVHRPGNHTHNQYFQFQLKCCGNSWQVI